MNIKQDSNCTGNSREGGERNRAGADVGEELIIGEEAICHEGEGDVHGDGLAGANLPGGDGRVTHVHSPVLEQDGAVVVFEADAVRILDGDARVEGEVEVDGESEYVEGEIEIGE